MGEQARTSDEIAGNLIIRLQVLDHKEFIREGNDLVVVRRISFEDSVNGTILTVKHFSGEFKVSTQDFGVIDPRQKYKIPGRGMKGGDLYVIFDIQYPPKTVRYVLTDSGSI
jgi:DnaJ-class molecular chaperone